MRDEDHRQPGMLSYPSPGQHGSITDQAVDSTSGLDQNGFGRHEFSARVVFVTLVRLIAVLERIDHEQSIEAHTQKGDARCRRACEVADA